MKHPPFIVLDGLDGTGKSTQCRSLLRWLAEQGIDAVGCADPGTTPLGNQLRAILLNTRAEIGSRAEALLFMASRAELVRTIIRPALDAGRVVISDRFVTANVVYQGYAGELPPDELRSMSQFSTGGLAPDLTLILDLPVELALRRRGREADRMEARGPGYADRIRKGFLSEAAREPDRIRVVDASASEADVQATLRQIIGDYLAQRGLTLGERP